MCLGIPGQIVEIVDKENQRAIADVEGVRREISVALLGIVDDDGEIISIGDAAVSEAVGVGDWVLIHVGFAMSKIDEYEAGETLRALKALGEAYEQEMSDFQLDVDGDGGDGDLDDPTALPPLGVSP